MAKEIPIHIIKKPDDWTLRMSLGGDEDMGFYCVYRGNLRKVAFMLAMVQDKIQQLIKTGEEPPTEPEDGKHTSPPNPAEDALRIVKAEFDYWSACAEAKADEGLSFSGMGACSNILAGFFMHLTPAEYEKRVKERSRPIGSSASDIGGEEP